VNYKLSDLIQKLIDIAKDILKIYIKIEEKFKGKSQVICIIARAMEKQEQKYIEYYEKLKNDLVGELNESIDFYLYDKAAKLLYEFKMHIEQPKINNVQDLIKFAVEIEKNNIGLLLDIQGRLLGKMDDVNNNIYKVFSMIIKEAEKHEKMFEDLLIDER
jgi:sugar phosphate isomerase/epimerase